MNTYFRAEWKIPDEEGPKITWIELDNEFYDVRKIEKFKNGDVFIANKDIGNEETNTCLSEKPYPSIAEMSSDNIEVNQISKDEFDEIWFQYYIR